MASDNVTTKILEVQVNYGDALTKIAQYRTEIDKVKEKQKELKKQFKDGEITQEEYHKSMESSKMLIDEYSTSAGILTRAVKNQLKSQKEQEGSLVQLRAELSNLTAEYDRLSRAEREGAKGDELKDKINRLTDELKSCEEGTQRFYRNVGNYKSALMGAGVSTQSLTDALSKECKTAEEARKANEVLQKAVDAIDPSAQGAQESIALLNSKIEENKKVIDEHQEQSSALFETMSELTGVNLNFGNSLEALSKNSSGSVLEGLNTKAKALWSTLTGLLANPMVLTFLGIAGVGMAVKWWYDYNKGLVEATKKTQEFTGLTGDALKAFRNEVQGTADTFGKDFTEVLGAANAVAQQFGISHQEAMKLVQDGFVAGADASGQFIDILGEYPAYFKEAGLSASQFIAITAQSSKMGIVSDKAVDTIKEANLRLREMSDGTKETLKSLGLNVSQLEKDLASGSTTTFEIMQQVSGKMSELNESSPLVAEAITNIFGGPGEDAGLQYLTTLKDISLNLDETKEKAGRLAELQEEQMQSQIELDNAIASVFDATGGSFEELTTMAKTWVNKGIVAMIKGCVDLCNWFIDLYNNSIVVRAGVAGISATFKMAWSIIKNVCKMIADEVMGLGQIIKGVLTLSWDDVSAGWDKFRKASTQAVKNVAKDYIDGVEGAVDEAMNGKLEKISVDLSKYSSDETSMPQGDKGTGGKKAGKSSSSSKKDSKDKKDKEAAAKVEAQLLRKAEDELLKITEEALETRRKKVENAYDRQIEDYKKKLATDKTLTEKSRQAILSIIDSLEKQKQQALNDFNSEELKKTIEHQNKLLELKLQSVKEQTDAEYDLKAEQLKNQEQLDLLAAEKEFTNEEEKQAALQAIRNRYAQENAELQDQRNQTTLDRQKAALQAEIDSMQLAEDERQLKVREGYEMSDEAYTEWRQRGLEGLEEHERNLLLKQEEVAQAELEALQARGQLSTQTTEQYEAEILAAKQKSAQAQANTNQAIIKDEQAKATAMKAVTSSLTGLLDTLGESNKTFAKISKVITLAQIAIDTGKALSAGIASASSMPFPANIAAIATTVATVLANIATAISTVKSAKFAKGGKVNGPGTGTSDSIPAMLSNGEFVMTAAATRMFEPVLTAMNNIGKGVPMQVANSYREIEAAETLTNSFETAAKEIRPVVSVVEISEAQERVDIIESLDNY